MLAASGSVSWSGAIRDRSRSARAGRQPALRYPPTTASANGCRAALQKMYLIRRFEEGAEDSYMRGLIHGTMHLSIGQEASAVGTCMALTDADQITSTHRGHGHCIAKGAEVSRMFAEFFGRTTAIAAAVAARCTSPTWQRATWAPTASSAADCRSR